MITVIIGTNRSGSQSAQIASICVAILKKLTDEEITLLDIGALDDFEISGMMYTAENQSPSIRHAQDNYIKPAHKWVVVLPEYNGGIPGIFKLFIDAISIRDYVDNFASKKVCLVGVSAGRAGNNRGLDHITNYFNYLGMNVFQNKLPISQIGSVLTKSGLEKQTLESLSAQLKAYVEF